MHKLRKQYAKHSVFIYKNKHSVLGLMFLMNKVMEYALFKYVIHFTFKKYCHCVEYFGGHRGYARYI